MNKKPAVKRSKREIRISYDVILELLKELELLVVSLDRLGSEYPQNLKRLDREMAKFFWEIRLFHRMARLRRVVWDAIDSQCGRAEIQQLEESIEKVKFWPNHRKVKRSA